MSQIRRIAIVVISAIAILLTVTACVTENQTANFGFVFKYGVGTRNELDTFRGTYTRDMVLDPSITIAMQLSAEELDRIRRKMVEIDFFNYPDEFSVTVPPGEPAGMVTPYPSYYFRVSNGDGFKELSWDAEIVEATTKDEKAERLRELIRLITDMIESKPEYQELPEPTSGYM